MKLSSAKSMRTGASFLLLALLSAAALPHPASAQQNFVNEGKNIPGFPEANARFVVLNSGVANIAAQKFQLPQSTMYFPLAGMTVFPYYQASKPLQEFLNNATIMGRPITSFPITPNIPQISLPQTDTIRFSVPIPKPGLDKRSAVKMAIKDKRQKDEIPWMVAHDGGQAFALPGDRDGMVIMSAGSMFGACMARTMALRSGIMWVMTGARPAAVLTRFGAVCVRPYSVTAVEQNWFNQVRVVNLYGQPVEFQINSFGNTKNINVEKGKELSISDTAIAAAGASDYVSPLSASKSADSKVVDSKLAELRTGVAKGAEPKTAGSETADSKIPEYIADLKLSYKNFDKDSSVYLRELEIMNPPFSDMKMISAYQQMFADYGITARMRKEETAKREFEARNLAKKSAVYKVSMDSRYYVPVYSKVEHQNKARENQAALLGARLESMKLPKGHARYLSASDLHVESDGKPLMNVGEVVISAGDKMLLTLQANQRVFMDSGALVHIVATPDFIAIRNISDQAKNSVKVRVKARTLECPIGSEILVGRTAPDLLAEMGRDGVGRRNVRSVEFADGTTFMNQAEFDLASLMKTSPLIKEMYKSKDATDRKIIAEMMKTTVAHNMVSQGVPYRKMKSVPASASLAAPH